jgi:hypothetical protein
VCVCSLVPDITYPEGIYRFSQLLHDNTMTIYFLCPLYLTTYVCMYIYIYNLRSAECVVINHAADRTNTGDASQHVAAIPVIARSHTDHSTLPRLAGPELAASGSALFFILLHVSA